MFRLANGMLSEDKELEELATFVVTETMKVYLSDYFLLGYQFIEGNELYKLVDIRKVKRILPHQLLDEMDELEIDTNRFLKKKVAQMMNELNSKETITFDMFNEYLLAKMIDYACLNDIEYSIGQVEEVVDTLESQLIHYVERYYECEDWDEVVEVAFSMFEGLTDFRCFSVGDGQDFIFWDMDYALFDEWGLSGLLWACEVGIMDTMGYSLDDIRNIFLSVA